MKGKSLSRVRLLATPWTAAYQAPPSMGFSRQSTGVGCHCLLRLQWLSVAKRHFQRLKICLLRVLSGSRCLSVWANETVPPLRDLHTQGPATPRQPPQGREVSFFSSSPGPSWCLQAVGRRGRRQVSARLLGDDGGNW